METPLCDPETGKLEFPLYLLPLEGGAFKTAAGQKIDKPTRLFLFHSCSVEIACKPVRIIHGRARPGSKDLATLMVLELRFLPRHPDRRVTEAEVKFTFRGSPGNEVSVARISPDVFYSISPTVTESQIRNELEVNAGAQIPPTPFNLGFLFRHSILRKELIRTSTRLVGDAVPDGDVPFGLTNCADWSFFENEKNESGVPTQIRVAMYVLRDNYEPFWCDVWARVDKNYSFRAMTLGSVSVKLDPKDELTTEKLEQLNLGWQDRPDSGHLEEVNLDELAGITVAQEIVNELKIVNIGPKN